MTVALRSPLAFWHPRPLTAEAMHAPPEAVAIRFESRSFVWHPPMEREDEMGRSTFGPMLAAVLGDNDDLTLTAHAGLRFLSAVAFYYDVPVQDEARGFIGGDGETDPFIPHGHRAQQPYPYVRRADAPSEVVVQPDRALQIALAYYREGLNAASPFYRCLAFRNVVDVTHEVLRETVGSSVTSEAAARDAFIDEVAPRYAAASGVAEPPAGWSHYLRDEVRNALAHVLRKPGRRQVNPDDPSERPRLEFDGVLLQRLAKAAVDKRWPDAVRAA